MSTALSPEGVVDPAAFFRILREEDVGPFVGVPCSLIKSLIAYAADHPEEVEFQNPAHESHAMAIAAGSWMATGKLPMVFLQNSGFGNIINPLTSLHQIYEIPALLLVTWRAEGGYGTDAPEHWIVGRDMEEYFRAFHLPYRILSRETWEEDLRAMKGETLSKRMPAVLCVRKGLFGAYERAPKPGSRSLLGSMEAIGIIKDMLPEALYLSTTGMISRESFTVRDSADFFMMGSMGLVSGIAAGASAHTEKTIVALDGDGALLMHLGLLPFIGRHGHRNLLHVVLDNEAYSSTGGQPTVSPGVDFSKVALACGYRNATKATTAEGLRNALKNRTDADGPFLLWIKVRSGNEASVARVSDAHTCPEVTERFLGHFRH